jgi:hypothetical protein
MENEKLSPQEWQENCSILENKYSGILIKEGFRNPHVDV